MSSISITACAGVRDIHERQFAREMAIRCVVAAVAVMVCYCFRWEWLRSLTADANLRLDALAGVHLQRLSFDTVAWQGQTYRYVIACTFADVWCGSLAFLWRMDDKVARNLAVIAGWSVALFAFNVFRLSVSDVLFALGLSWNLAHNVVSGIAYFAVWQVLWWRLNRRRRTSESTFSRIPVENR
jgi:hypothetical protein